MTRLWFQRTNPDHVCLEELQPLFVWGFFCGNDLTSVPIIARYVELCLQWKTSILLWWTVPAGTTSPLQQADMPGGHTGGLDVLRAPGRNRQHHHLLGHDHSAILSGSAAFCLEKPHKTSGCSSASEACWHMTLGVPAACEAGTASEADAQYITETVQLPFCGSTTKSHPGGLTIWSTISAFQGEALIVKQSALPHWEENTEACCLEMTSETHLWEAVKLAHKNPWLVIRTEPYWWKGLSTRPTVYFCQKHFVWSLKEHHKWETEILL